LSAALSPSSANPVATSAVSLKRLREDEEKPANDAVKKPRLEPGVKGMQKKAEAKIKQKNKLKKLKKQQAPQEPAPDAPSKVVTKTVMASPFATQWSARLTHFCSKHKTKMFLLLSYSPGPH